MISNTQVEEAQQIDEKDYQLMQYAQAYEFLIDTFNRLFPLGEKSEIRPLMDIEKTADKTLLKIQIKNGEWYITKSFAIEALPDQQVHQNIAEGKL